MYQSTKIIDGFSTCFRQWKATDTHCKFLHGYSISFKVVFQGELDDRNWVMSFGLLKEKICNISIPIKHDIITLKEFFEFMFDHTTIIAEDDPALEAFKRLHDNGIIQLRVLPAVGCEKFAQFVFDILNQFVEGTTNKRVSVVSVECKEHFKNSAIYYGQDL